MCQTSKMLAGLWIFVFDLLSVLISRPYSIMLGNVLGFFIRQTKARRYEGGLNGSSRLRIIIPHVL